MNCYTYSDGKILSGIDINGTKHKTCALKLSIPYDGDTDRFIDAIRSKELADILLYGCAETVVGDSNNSVIPQNSVLLRCMDVVHCVNINNSCFEVNAGLAGIDFVLFENSCVHDTKNDTYIKNSNGKAVLCDTPVNTGEQISDNADHTILF